MKKKNLLVLLVTLFTLVTTMTAFAGSWNQDAKGWWYQNDDGSYVVNTWQWIDGNNDGVAESYCFDGNGYLLVNTTTPDNYQVNVDGAWLVDGGVQTKVVTVGNGTSSNGTGQSGGSTGGASNVGDTIAKDEDIQYVTKRYSTAWNRKVEGGTVYGYFDYTGWRKFDKDTTYKYRENRGFVAEGEFFCPDNIRFPACTLAEVIFEGDKLVKATPIWIDNGEWTYGGFSNAEKDIVGRSEWRTYEVSDPEYAAQMKEELVEEAMQRAFKIYPDMIVDYEL